MNHDNYSDTYLRGILESVKSVAIIGASANEIRPSFFLAKYLVQKHYDIFPINPGRAGGEIADARVFASLADLPNPVDMVDIFRKAEALPAIVDEILQMEQLPSVVWFQLGIRNDAAASRLEAAGIKVVQNRCPKIEYGRLCGEIGWVGYNRRVISAKKPSLAKGYQHFGLGPAKTKN